MRCILNGKKILLFVGKPTLLSLAESHRYLGKTVFLIGAKCNARGNSFIMKLLCHLFSPSSLSHALPLLIRERGSKLTKLNWKNLLFTLPQMKHSKRVVNTVWQQQLPEVLLPTLSWSGISKEMREMRGEVLIVMTSHIWRVCGRWGGTCSELQPNSSLPSLYNYFSRHSPIILHYIDCSFFTLNSLQRMITCKKCYEKKDECEVTPAVCYPFLQIYFLWWRMTCTEGEMCIPSLPCRLQVSLSLNIDIESYVHGSDVFASTDIQPLFDTLLWKRRMRAARYVTSRTYFLLHPFFYLLYFSAGSRVDYAFLDEIEWKKKENSLQPKRRKESQESRKDKLCVIDGERLIDFEKEIPLQKWTNNCLCICDDQLVSTLVYVCFCALFLSTFCYDHTSVNIPAADVSDVAHAMIWYDISE